MEKNPMSVAFIDAHESVDDIRAYPKLYLKN